MAPRRFYTTWSTRSKIHDKSNRPQPTDRIAEWSHLREFLTSTSQLACRQYVVRIFAELENMKTWKTSTWKHSNMKKRQWHCWTIFKLVFVHLRIEIERNFIVNATRWFWRSDLKIPDGKHDEFSLRPRRSDDAPLTNAGRLASFPSLELNPFVLPSFFHRR